MKRKRFDFVFALGAACSCSRMLRERGLQFSSLPLDWVGDPCMDAGEDLRLTTDIVLCRFANWFRKENLVRAREYDSVMHVGYYDRGTKLYFVHDFSPTDDVDVCYPAVREKYARRIERFQRLLGSARSVLVVWVADPRGSGELCEADLVECVARFRRAYPGVEFMLLAVNCIPGIDPASARVECGDGYECHSFDYRVVKTGKPTWDVRTELFSPLFDRYEAVDYRTRGERRANARREKRRAYEKYNAGSWFEYVVNRLQFKIYRHFKRRLERKGVELGGG